MFCPECGHENDNEARYCGDCGTGLDAFVAEPVSTTPDGVNDAAIDPQATGETIIVPPADSGDEPAGVPHNTMKADEWFSTSGAFCPACGGENPLAAAFCSECGTDIAPAPYEATPMPAGGIYCPACGWENPAGMVYCLECGQLLEPVMAAATAGQPGRFNFEKALPFMAIGALVLAIGITAAAWLMTRTQERETTDFAQFEGALAPTSDIVSMFRGNPQHTGLYDNSASDPRDGAKWRFKTGDRIVSSPAVVENTVYFGSQDHNVYALDTENGQEKWRFTTGDMVDSSPVVTGETVYVGSRDGSMYAVNAVNGQEIWRFRTGGQVDSSPAIASGMIYFGSQDGFFYALDASGGVEKWRFATGGRVHSPPTVDNDTVYFGSSDNQLYALDAASGQLKWQFTAAGQITCSPAVADGTLYLGSHDGHAYAIDAASGQERWRYKTGNIIDASPSVASGIVYFGSQDGKVYALDAGSGQERWQHTTEGGVFSSAAVTGGSIFVGSKDGHLYALDSESGGEKWRFQTKDWVMPSPTVSRGTVFVGSLDGNLYAITTDGEGPPLEEDPQPLPPPQPLPQPRQPEIPVVSPVPAPDIIQTYSTDNRLGAPVPGRLLVAGGGHTGDNIGQLTHNNTYHVYNYFLQRFNYNGFDGLGSPIKSTVHYYFTDDGPMNAGWDPFYRQFMYGDGNGTHLGPTGSANDVVAHEYTHGIIESNVGNDGLAYVFESGALNESFADVFAAMFDPQDWLIAEDVVTPAKPGDALRSLEDPERYGQPAHTKDFVYTYDDHGGVHINSGIPNKAAYNVATAIGRQKTEEIWWRAMTLHLHTYSTFDDARAATVRAAEELYGVGSVEAVQVNNGWAYVGVGSAITNTNTTPTATAPAPGQTPQPAAGGPARPQETTSASDFSGAMLLANPHRTSVFETDGKKPAGTVKHQLDGSGLIAGGIMYLDNTAYDLESGKEKWKFTKTSGSGTTTGTRSSGRTGTTPSSTVDANIVAIADGTAYLNAYSSSGSSGTGTLYAASATDGSKKWEYTVSGMLAKSPVVEGGIVYTYSGSYGSGSTIYAISASDGTKVWEYDTSESLGYELAVADGVLYFGGGYSRENTDKNLYALDARTGKLKWKSPTIGAVVSTPAIAEGTVFFTSGKEGDRQSKQLIAVDAATGKERWQFRVEGYVTSSAAVDDGVVYVNGFDDKKNRLYAIDAATGKEKWKFESGNMQQSDGGSGAIYLKAAAPAIADGVIYLGGDDRYLYAIDAATGKEKWKYQADGRVNGIGVNTDGLVYFTTMKDTFYVLR